MCMLCFIYTCLLCICIYIVVQLKEAVDRQCSKSVYILYTWGVSKRCFVDSCLGLTLHTHDPDTQKNKENTQTEACTLTHYIVTNVSTHLEFMPTPVSISFCV